MESSSPKQRASTVEELSDDEPSDINGEGHPAPTNLKTPTASDSEEDQQLRRLPASRALSPR
jgi:hypothetical protein